MGYTVETRIIGGGLATAMADMRAWLDQRRLQPNGFRQRDDGPAAILQVSFNSEHEAVSFAEAFAGQLLGTNVKLRETSPI
jgi:hypothetical protein